MPQSAENREGHFRCLCRVCPSCCYSAAFVILDTEDLCRQVSQIGPDLKFVPVQVRKDLQFTGVIGKPKIGYSVAELVVAIESFLGWDIVKEAILVGVGHLEPRSSAMSDSPKLGCR
jgi:NADH/NAD ratio-sensing transcriptional regulator Rex